MSPDEFERVANGREVNVAVICGETSGGLVVVDVDGQLPPSLNQLMNKTLTTMTSKGAHFYFRMRNLPANFKTRIDNINIDVKSQGGYVVAPPSIHKTGHVYQFLDPAKAILEIESLSDVGINPPMKSTNMTIIDRGLIDVLYEGERNNQLFRSATVDREQGVTVEAAIERAQALNLKSCKPPLPATEVYGLVQSAYSKDYFAKAAQSIVNGDLKPDIATKSLKALEQYVEDLRVRIVGEQLPAEPYESIDGFYDDLVKFYQTSLRLDELTPYLFASYTLLTHQTPNLDFIFQVYITGLKGSGKSTSGERLENLCYQGFKTGSATFPFLVRANEVLNGMTQVLDEFDLISSDDRVTKYLRGSSDRRNPYGVVEPVSIGGATYNMPAIKMSFGGRVLITSQALKDEMVRDRAVEVVMMQYAGLLPEPSGEEINKLRKHLAYYREQVKLQVTVEDKRKHYDPKHSSGRLNELATLLYLVTPEKHHDKIATIIKREWETRTALERESYAAKVVESLTAAVTSQDVVESSTAQSYVPVQQIKRHFDLRYSDSTTGKGKANPKSIGRVMQNLGLRTDLIRVRDEDQRLRAWLLNKSDLTRIRQSLYLDEAPELGGTSVTSGTSPSAPLPLDTYPTEDRERPVHTQGNVPLVPLVPEAPTT
jgi:hypothetical protein